MELLVRMFVMTTYTVQLACTRFISFFFWWGDNFYLLSYAFWTLDPPPVTPHSWSRRPRYEAPGWRFFIVFPGHLSFRVILVILELNSVDWTEKELSRPKMGC
jgi:hypothetical protein